jgi:hypothetical protein
MVRTIRIVVLLFLLTSVLAGCQKSSAAAGEALAAQFLEENVALGTWLTRGGPIDRIVEPAEETFEGPLLILIDIMSTSQSEHFAAGMLQGIDSQLEAAIEDIEGVVNGD